MTDWVDVGLLSLQGAFLLVGSLGAFLYFPSSGKQKKAAGLLTALVGICLGIGIFFASFSVAQHQAMVVCVSLLSFAVSLQLISIPRVFGLIPSFQFAIGITLSISCFFTYPTPSNWFFLLVLMGMIGLAFAKKISLSLQNYCQGGAFIVALTWLAEPVYAHAFSHKKPIQTVQWDFFTSLPAICTVIGLVLLVVIGLFIPRKHKF
ncbi:hypothetical protein R9C00_09940 [Flammeovirgaceae bacterium SG7u.111]|nr:hypothetical protein [Flammeovirgaceae bacterium SG7u.132]WPO37772.1 hypothetical protein R9C00_09940 [Flammeovirgaceae bacterium SG7u.111]